jgi:coproporphyrinogen III oxidase
MADSVAVYDLLKEMQSLFVEELEGITLAGAEEGSSRGTFVPTPWVRDDGKHGGGTRLSVEETPVFNRASINVSQVHYEDVPTSPVIAASALSVILHPKNPHAPSMHFHMSYTVPRNRAGEEVRQPYWRMIADLNPSIAVAEDTAAFEKNLRAVVPPALVDDSIYFGDKYFDIPDLGRTRGASHLFIPKLENSDMPLDESMGLARSLASSTIRLYASLVQSALDRRPDPSLLDRQAQLAYHTLYFYQVLLLDRGTTHGILAHDDNDVGTLGSIPMRVNASLLEEWQGQTTSSNAELLRRLRALLPASGVATVSDPLRAALAATLREFYREDRSRIEEQAWMDLEWWAARQQGAKEKVLA